MTKDIMTLYDLAEEGEEGTHWSIPFLGETLAAQIENQHMVYMWFQNAGDIDEMFDTRDYSGPGEFEDAVDEWVEEHR